MGAGIGSAGMEVSSGGVTLGIEVVFGGRDSFDKAFFSGGARVMEPWEENVELRLSGIFPREWVWALHLFGFDEMEKPD